VNFEELLCDTPKKPPRAMREELKNRRMFFDKKFGRSSKFFVFRQKL